MNRPAKTSVSHSTLSRMLRFPPVVTMGMPAPGCSHGGLDVDDPVGDEHGETAVSTMAHVMSNRRSRMASRSLVTSPRRLATGRLKRTTEHQRKQARRRHDDDHQVIMCRKVVERQSCSAGDHDVGRITHERGGAADVGGEDLASRNGTGDSQALTHPEVSLRRDAILWLRYRARRRRRR